MGFRYGLHSLKIYLDQIHLQLAFASQICKKQDIFLTFTKMTHILIHMY